MADSLANLRQTLANVEAQLVTLTGQILPDHSLDGEGVQWGAHVQYLLAWRKDLREQIIAEEGPTEIRSQGWY
jgi:hypothetical protein